MSEFKRSHEIKKDSTIEMADYAAKLRREQGLSLVESVGKTLDYFGIDKNDRETIGDKVKKELGRRGGESSARKKKEAKERKGREVYGHWQSEAHRAGFDDVDKFLEHLKE